MSNRCKAAILLGILCFYIILSALEIAQNSKTDDKQSNNQNKNSQSEEITVGNRHMNLSEYLNKSRVRAFKFINKMEFAGRWNLRYFTDSELFGELESEHGLIQLQFIENDIGHYGRKTKNSTIKLDLIEGKYSDDRTTRFEFTELLHQVFNETTLQYSIPAKISEISQLEHLSVQKVTECNVSINMDLSNLIMDDETAKAKFKINPDGIINLRIFSLDCAFEITSELKQDGTDIEKKTINYSVLLTFIAIINLYSVAKMIKQCVESPVKATQFSLITMAFVLAWDTFICFAHLFAALNKDKLFHFLIMPTFWYFILFSIFEMKLLLIIWKARYSGQFQNPEQERKALANFYFKLYMSVIVSLCLLFKFILSDWFVLAMSFYLVPQIIHSAMRGGRINFDQNYIFLVIGLRAILPLYFRGCPYNIMQLRPSFFFCSSLILIIGAQILLVYYQSIYGSKFFVPARFLPQQYNYLIDMPDDIEHGSDVDDCAICMAALNEPIEAASATNPHSRLILSRLNAKKSQIMQTPCHHKFHVSCLVEWMSIKMECPTCRSALPVLD